MAFSNSASFNTFQCGICGHSVISRNPRRCMVCGTLLCTECNRYGLCRTHFERLNAVDQTRVKNIESQRKARQRNWRIKCIPCIIFPFIFTGGKLPLGWLILLSVLVLSLIITLFFSRYSRSQDTDAVYAMELEEILQKYHFPPASDGFISGSTRTHPKFTPLHMVNSNVNQPKKICPYCGAENSSDYRICLVCGNIFDG
jgi:hypothetical protein